jgi:FtsP/CotA-like multicopper oxidase with cupredoxin domain
MTISKVGRRLFIILSLCILAALLLTIAGFTVLARARDLFGPRGQAREYWIAVVPVSWNIVPTGVDGMNGQKFAAKDTTFEALIYRQYTPNWERALPDPFGGMPGPTFYGEVGDTLVVHFKNLDSFYHRPHSIHPHGVHYTPVYDGAYVQSNVEGGSAVPEGGSYIYQWKVGSDSVGRWVYHDHSVEAMDNAERGMYGNLIITEPGTPQPDKRFFVFFNQLDAKTTGLSQTFFTINGHAYIGNTPTYKARVGERVEWVVAALGSEFHAFHIHGHRWKDTDHYQDVLGIVPAQSLMVEFVEDNPGLWLVHCHVDTHMMAGMTALYEVDE